MSNEDTTRHMVVGAGSFGRGLSEFAAIAEWARRADVRRLRTTEIEVKVYRGDENLEFPPSSENLRGERTLSKEFVGKLRRAAQALDGALDDPEYAEDLFPIR